MRTGHYTIARNKGCNVPDTDGDGLCDFEELLRKTPIDEADTDQDGLSDNIDPEPYTADLQAPSISLISPSKDAVLQAGKLEQFHLDIEEAGMVGTLQVSIDGNAINVPNTPPYQFSYAIPLNSTMIELSINASDISGNQAQPLIQQFSTELPLNTEITGQVVVREENPDYNTSSYKRNGISGLNIRVNGQPLETTTNETGHFSIPEVITYLGEINLIITGRIEGQSIGIAINVSEPVSDGVTNLGEIGVFDHQEGYPLVVDSDDDGVLDLLEYAYETDSNSEDSDQDGLLDLFEIQNNLNPLSPVGQGEQLLDSDGDGLNNAQEQNARTNINDPDSDRDGLTDGDEVNTYSTSPLHPDSDGDELTDGEEVSRGTDPKTPDTDGDGLSDQEEHPESMTSPLLYDTDGDGMSDGYEVRFGLLNENADADLDNDGLTNIQEHDLKNQST